MKILVTGASGFLGKTLCPALRARGWEVFETHSRDADLTRFGSLDKYNLIHFDRIYHLAAWTQAGDFCLYHPGEQWIINQKINTHVLSWRHEWQPQAKLISMGTSCSYEEGRELSEENYLRGSPIQELYTYGMCKRMLHIGQMSLAKQFGYKYLTVVPATLYGPGHHTDGRQMHFIFDLIRKIMLYKHRGETVTLWGDGNQRRELVFVSDFVDTLIALDERVENDLYNVGAGEDHTIREFAEMICKIAGVDSSDIRYDASKYVGAKSKMLSTKKLDALLPSRARTALHAGLEINITNFEQSLK